MEQPVLGEFFGEGHSLPRDGPAGRRIIRPTSFTSLPASPAGAPPWPKPEEEGALMVQPTEFGIASGQQDLRRCGADPERRVHNGQSCR